MADEFKTTKVMKSVDPYVDVGNLLIEDLDPFDVDEYKARRNEYLKSVARDNAQYLINKIWELPTERIEDAIVVTLPDPVSRIPREKPVPKIRPETKWDRFAKLKGIKNTKKSRMVWDEESKSWKPRWGYKRANDDTKDWLIEIPDQRDEYRDYIGERMEKKKERVAKTELKRLRNLRNQNESVGLNVDDKSPQQLSQQVHAALKSTASVGKYTERLPKEKRPKNTGNKRKFLPNETNVNAEKTKQLEIFNRMTSKRPKLDVGKAVSQHVQNEQRQSERSGEENGVDSGGKFRQKPKNQRRSAQGRPRRNNSSTKFRGNQKRNVSHQGNHKKRNVSHQGNRKRNASSGKKR